MSDTQGNVPADLTPTPQDEALAISLFTMATDTLGPVPNDPGERRNYGYKAAELAAALAGDFDRPLASLTNYLVQVRAASDRRPAKGILRSVEEIKVGDSSNGKPLNKVEFTIEATSGGKFSKVGDMETFRSNFTHHIGYKNLLDHAKGLIGREVLVYKFLEDTEGRGGGPTANVAVRIVPIGAAPVAQPADPAAAELERPEPAPEPVEAPEAVESGDRFAAARAENPGTKRDIVVAIIEHFGVDQDAAAEACKRIASDLKIDIAKPTAENIKAMWDRYVNEVAAEAAAA